MTRRGLDSDASLISLANQGVGMRRGDSSCFIWPSFELKEDED